MRALAAARRASSGHAAMVLALAISAGSVLAQDLCGRPQESPQALFDRLTKTEKLKEDFRDKSYVAVSDTARGTVWTFTVAGHPAHPSVVCRRPVQDGAEMRLQMYVQCNAPEAKCQELVKGFQELNQRMIRELERQKK